MRVCVRVCVYLMIIEVFIRSQDTHMCTLSKVASWSWGDSINGHPQNRFLLRNNAPVICIPGSLGAGDSGDIAGPKCRDLTFDESRQCRRCAGVLISCQNANLCHILTARGKLSLYICTV